MKIKIEHDNKYYSADLSKPKDISIELGKVNSFHRPPPSLSPVVEGKFIGRVTDGSPVNFYDVAINPHAHGTHTECLGHITKEHQSLNNSLKDFHFISTLVSVQPITRKEDFIIHKSCFPDHFFDQLNTTALVIRTLPNSLRKKHIDYSGTNPPFIDANVMKSIVKSGVKHLLIDLPSVDKESDGGKLVAHKIFWGIPDNLRYDCTITEFAYIDNKIKDGLYLLNLNFAPISLDASPSRPVLYALRRRIKF